MRNAKPMLTLQDHLEVGANATEGRDIDGMMLVRKAPAGEIFVSMCPMGNHGKSFFFVSLHG